MSRLYRPISLLAAATLLSGSYALAKSWVGVAAVIAMAAFWVIGRRFQWIWLNSALLTGYLSAAAGGILLGAPPHWMIAGSAFALAAWELAGQSTTLANSPTNPWVDLLLRKSLRLLALSVGSGLLAAELLLLIRVPLPFAVILLAGLLGFSSLYLFFRTQKGHPD